MNRHPIAFYSLFVGLSGLFLPVGSPDLAARENASLEPLTEGFERAIELRETLSREEEEWARHKSILKSEVTLLEQRLATAKEEIATLERQQAEALERREKLLRERESETVWMESMETVREEIAPLLQTYSRSLPEWMPAELRTGAEEEEGEDTYLWFETRLNRLAETLMWNSRVETESRRIQPQSGSEHRVEILSFGLGGAYYTSPDGSLAGYYVYRDGKWRRREQAELGPAVLDALERHKGTRAPELIRLPVERGEENGQ